MSADTRMEVRVVSVTDSEAIKVADRFWVMRANYHLEDGRTVEFTGGMHQTRKAARAAGARLEAEVGNTKAVWHPGDEGNAHPTFVVSKFTTGTDPVTGKWGLVPDWDAD
jgi:hypothetical protein